MLNNNNAIVPLHHDHGLLYVIGYYSLLAIIIGLLSVIVYKKSKDFFKVNGNGKKAINTFVTANVIGATSLVGISLSASSQISNNPPRIYTSNYDLIGSKYVNVSDLNKVTNENYHFIVDQKSGSTSTGDTDYTIIDTETHQKYYKCNLQFSDNSKNDIGLSLASCYGGGNFNSFIP